MKTVCLLVVGAWALLAGSAAGQERPQRLEVPKGFQVEIVAREPLTMDPVDFDWGPDGKLWVVEMADYPLGIDGKGKAGGRVRILEDADGDGQYDRSTLFADGLNTPTGILVWRGGVLVTAAPDVLYLEDVTGDGKADKRVVLFTGFGEGNQQHRINGLRWGLDNWVYLANGDSGGTVRSLKTGQSIDISGRDLRIRPDTGELETVAGQTQFGRNPDDWGNWFGCNNPNPIFHYVLEEHYLKRNPHLAPPALRRDIRQGDTRVYPIAEVISHCDPKYRPLDAIPTFTSCCGVLPYRDDLFGPEYENVTFTSEPVYNLVHARKLIPRGVTFESVKLQAETEEFFRSQDPWSRPAALHVGPDGALYVADMVRQVIEHPEWIADELEKTLDVRSGHQEGRLYRISPVDKPRRPVARLDQLDTTGLVAALDSPSGWQRDLVQRMLLWNPAPEAVAPLEKLARECPRPQARLQALCTLDGLGKLTPDLVQHALKDQHPGVRRHAIRLCEQFLKPGDGPWKDPLVKLVQDDDPHVRLQLAYTLGEARDAWAGAALARAALHGQQDEYLTAAILSSLSPDHLPALLNALTPGDQVSPELQAQLTTLATRMSHADAVQKLLDASQPGPDTWAFLVRWLELLGNDNSLLEKRLTPAALARLDELMDRARQEIRDESLPLSNRQSALKLLGRRSPGRAADIQLLTAFLVPAQPVEIQVTAVETLGATRDGTVPLLLLENWKAHGPAVRAAILEVLLSQSAWSRNLLQEIERGTLTANSLSAAQRQQLTGHRADDIRELAAKVLTVENTDRQAVLDQFRPVLKLVEDEQRSVELGEKVFGKRCAACHRLNDKGTLVGPDLAAITNRSPEALLIAILDPSRAVEAKYLQYQVVTKAGVIHTGLLTEETSTSVTLLAAEGKRQQLLRTDIDILQGSNQSMMPIGIEKDVTPEELADLIVFLMRLPRPVTPRE